MSEQDERLTRDEETKITSESQRASEAPVENERVLGDEVLENISGGLLLTTTQGNS